jgi:hypothetical protein
MAQKSHFHSSKVSDTRCASDNGMKAADAEDPRCANNGTHAPQRRQASGLDIFAQMSKIEQS